MTDKKVALVVGGGSGMGAACARSLHEKGFHIGILSSSGKGEELAKSLGGVGVTGTNRSVSDLQALVDQTMKQYGRIDALINSAGHGPRGPILEISDEDWHEGLETYFLNVVRATRLVVPIMQEQNDGAIVNISTFATFEPDPGFPTSAVFRSGLASFAKLVSDQYAQNNIRVNNVLPGFIDSFPVDDNTVARIPLKRYGTTEEIGECVAFLASSAAAYITGQNIRVDGGLTRSV